MRLGIDEWSFHSTMMMGKLDVLDFPAVASRLGAEGICLDYFMLPSAIRRDPAPLKERLDENNIELIFGFSVPFALPASVIRLSTGMKRRMFELAHFFGSTILRTIGAVVIPIPGLGRPIQVVLSRSSEVKRVIRNFKPFVEEARSEGITVALENHSDYKVGEMERILEGVGSDNLKVTLDTGNAVMHREDPYDTAKRLAPYAAYTHIKNMKGSGYTCRATPLGEGEIDIRRIIKIIHDSGYNGLYAVELDYNLWEWKKEEPAVQASLEYMKTIAEEV